MSAAFNESKVQRAAAGSAEGGQFAAKDQSRASAGQLDVFEQAGQPDTVESVAPAELAAHLSQEVEAAFAQGNPDDFLTRDEPDGSRVDTLELADGTLVTRTLDAQGRATAHSRSRDNVSETSMTEPDGSTRYRHAVGMDGSELFLVETKPDGSWSSTRRSGDVVELNLGPGESSGIHASVDDTYQFALRDHDMVVERESDPLIARRVSRDVIPTPKGDVDTTIVHHPGSFKTSMRWSRGGDHGIVTDEPHGMMLRHTEQADGTRVQTRINSSGRAHRITVGTDGRLTSTTGLVGVNTERSPWSDGQYSVVHGLNGKRYRMDADEFETGPGTDFVIDPSRHPEVPSGTNRLPVR